MKYSKITAAIAATATAAIASNAVAQGDWNGIVTNGAAAEVSAIAIIGNTQLVDGIRALQGFPAACTGNLTKICAPSISSAELRALLSNDTASVINVKANFTDNLSVASGYAGKLANLKEFTAPGVVDALRSFNGSGVVGGLACGQANPINLAPALGSQTEGSVVASVGASGANIGFVHATELDGTVGFIKLDGSAPDLLNLASSNYNLVSNLATASGIADKSVNGTTVGVVGVAAGIASHTPSACSALTTGTMIGDISGGSL